MKPDYLRPTAFFDYQSPSIQSFADTTTGTKKLSDVEVATCLYYAVRDKIAYNPYVFSLDKNSFSGSYCLVKKESYCIPKAILLGTLARYKGIPSRLGLADVKNHISSSKLSEILRSEVFVMHGYIELFLEGKWVKATPAFDKALCQKIKVEPLDFDGKTDSVFQEFDPEGNKVMEYLKDHGNFDDVPLGLILQSLQTAYPHLFTREALEEFHQHSLVGDLESERELTHE